MQHGPVTVSEVVDELDIPQGTAYDYVQNLETAGLVEKTREDLMTEILDDTDGESAQQRFERLGLSGLDLRDLP